MPAKCLYKCTFILQVETTLDPALENTLVNEKSRKFVLGVSDQRHAFDSVDKSINESAPLYAYRGDCLLSALGQTVLQFKKKKKKKLHQRTTPVLILFLTEVYSGFQ